MVVLIYSTLALIKSIKRLNCNKVTLTTLYEMIRHFVEFITFQIGIVSQTTIKK